MSEFGEKLKQLRQDKKISQRKLAELIGIDFTYISKIENGTMEPPAEDKIIKIAEVFDVNSDDLIILAKKIPTDFQSTITQIKEIPMFLRKAPSFSDQQWEQIKRIMNQNNEGE